MKKANILVWAVLRHAVPSHLISTSKTNDRILLTLVWAGLRHAVPSHLISKSKTNDRTLLTLPPSLIIENNVFDILMEKSKDYYTMLISKKHNFLIVL